jgi:hypothetical protein
MPIRLKLLWIEELSEIKGNGMSNDREGHFTTRAELFLRDSHLTCLPSFDNIRASGALRNTDGVPDEKRRRA